MHLLLVRLPLCIEYKRIEVLIRRGKRSHSGIRRKWILLGCTNMAKSCSRFVEMTAGILICCMPTTAAVLNRLYEVLTSYISPSSEAQRVPSGARALDECGHGIETANLPHQRRASFKPARTMGRQSSLSIDLGYSSDLEHGSADQESCTSYTAENYIKTTINEIA